MGSGRVLVLGMRGLGERGVEVGAVRYPTLAPLRAGRYYRVEHLLGLVGSRALCGLSNCPVGLPSRASISGWAQVPFSAPNTGHR